MRKLYVGCLTCGTLKKDMEVIGDIHHCKCGLKIKFIDEEWMAKHTGEFQGAKIHRLYIDDYIEIPRERK